MNNKSKNKEIERLEFFIKNSPAMKTGVSIKSNFQNDSGVELSEKNKIDADKAFIKYSERGIKTDLLKLKNPLRFLQLKEAKRWQGILIHEMWEPGILGGDIDYWTILGGEDEKEILPRNIVDFLKKEIFSGKDADIIEDIYNKICEIRDSNIDKIKYPIKNDLELI